MFIRYYPESPPKGANELEELGVFLIFSGSLHFRRIMRFYPN
jgi:hypothetical protein